MVELRDIEVAAERIKGHVRRTPILTVEAGAFGSAEVVLKLEQLQHTGSFKARGAFNRILAAREAHALPEAGVLAASGGNAGLAVAYAARTLGVPAEVYVPTSAPEVKVARLRSLGATVVQVGSQYAEAYEAAMQRHEVTGALFCHAYDQPDVVAGQGTLGLELLEQAGSIDTVLVAVGGGGLMAGVATALSGRARVIGVEPATIPTLSTALAQGRPVDVEVSGVAVDSLGARRLGSIAFEGATREHVGSLLVADEAIVQARRHLWDSCRLVAEHGTAAAIAALLTGTFQPAPQERVAVLVCGANTDPTDLATPRPA